MTRRRWSRPSAKRWASLNRWLLEFSSEEEANRRSEPAETKPLDERWASLLDGEPAFHNLDVVEHVEE